ncbi:MAG: adenylate/guanylate cyclase domain-containing protein, partial [Chromatiales bacterium]|nr:adenylate/guanylate cyclase domain-containing protein [Chromatiales bacterium]
LGFVLDYRKGEPIGQLPEPPEIINHQKALDALKSSAATNYTANIASLQRATPFAGFFSLQPDIDGVIRHAPMLTRIGNQIYPSLSLEILRVFNLVDEIEVITSTISHETVIEEIRIGESVIPTDKDARATIPFRGGWGSFPYISAVDILRGAPLQYSLEGTIVLIGTTAHGLFDLRSTPTEAIYPGVEVHANLISGALDQSYPYRPAWGDAVNFLIVLFLGALIAFVLPSLTPFRMFINSVIGIFTITLFNFWLWQETQFIIDLALPILMIFSISLFNISYGFLYESNSRNRLKGMFGQYVPPELVKEMSDNPESSYGFEGESREMSVMFCDIRSFTSISEKLSAEELKNLLNQFFTPMTHIIFEHRGTIDKYVGDMIMAFWGAPLNDEQHAVHSVEAALAMLEKCSQLDKTLSKKFNTQSINIGLGINTGKMNVGDMGSIYRRSYTVLGDAVNLGSRFEALTKYYGVSLLIGEETRRQLGDRYLCREIDKVMVKGKQEPISIFEPKILMKDASKTTLEIEERYSYCRKLFLERRWNDAKEAFTNLKATEKSTICNRYLERIELYQTSPPDDGWEGVFQHKEKSGG